MTTLPLLPGVRGYADVSPDAQYRWSLTRRWDEDNDALVCFVMLNPSVADGWRDDLTLRKCQEFARRWGMGACSVVNLYALRSSDPHRLRRHPDPVGPGNDRQLIAHATGADQVVVAWGATLPHGGPERARDVLAKLAAADVRPWRIGAPTLAGHPKHPSRLAYATQREPHGWTP